MAAPVKVLLAVVLLLAPTLALEAGVRTLIESGRLPLAPSSNDFADVSLANLIRRGKPDILIIGTSSVRNAIQPDVLEGLIEAEIGREVKVQGIAQSAMSLEAQLLLVQGLEALDLLPDVVITGLTPISLNGDNRDGDWFIHSELGKLWSSCRDTPDPGATLDCWLGEASAAWRWRGRPERLLEAVSEGIPVTFRERDRTLHPNGWTTAPPATARELREELPLTLKRVMPGIRVPPFVIIDFARLVTELRDQGATVVPVTMPYAELLEAALIARNPRWDEQRWEGFALLEQTSEIDLIKVDGFGEWAEPSSFHDLRHLSRKGAEPFTRQLWEMPSFREAVLGGLSTGDPAEHSADDPAEPSPALSPAP